MPVSALFSAVGANPVKPVHLVFHRFDEVLARENGVRHEAALFAGVSVNVDIGGLLLNFIHVVAVFALLAFLAHARLKHWAQNLLVN